MQEEPFRNAVVAYFPPLLSLSLSFSPASKGDTRRRAPREGQRLVEADYRLRAAGRPLARNPFSEEAQGVSVEKVFYGASAGEGRGIDRWGTADG